MVIEVAMKSEMMEGELEMEGAEVNEDERTRKDKMRTRKGEMRAGGEETRKGEGRAEGEGNHSSSVLGRTTWLTCETSSASGAREQSC